MHEISERHIAVQRLYCGTDIDTDGLDSTTDPVENWSHVRKRGVETGAVFTLTKAF